jgi:hypothetical protein
LVVTPARAGLERGLALVHSDVEAFSRAALPERALRQYQLPAARAIVESVDKGLGRELAVVFSRQSGKDEMLAQLCAFLLSRYRFQGGNVVVGLPALRPQGIIARDRLVERLQMPLTRNQTRLRDGTIVEVGRASARFLSASRNANSRGNTADLLLVANEAQDIEPDVWDSVFAPMAASSNATTVFLGTVWSGSTLLARQMRLLNELERADGIQRVFKVPWREVATELPVYGDYVRRQIGLLGEQHPFIKTEYELEELDGAGGLFPPERRGLAQGSFPPVERPDGSNAIYALAIDVAGEEEDGLEGAALRQAQPRKDSTAVAVVRIVPGEQPRFEVVTWYLWTGTRHTALHERIVQLATRVWNVRQVVIDATGVGAGLAAFLRQSLGERMVTPFVFSSASKSQLAWEFLGLIDSGRFQVFDPSNCVDREQARLGQLFLRQMEACRYTVLPGPGRLVRWGVEDERLHDDLLMAAALVSVLHRSDWRPRTARAR